MNRRPPACKAGALPLSYAPDRTSPRELGERWRMVGPGRLELPTSRLSSARSNQLSYEPDCSFLADLEEGMRRRRRGSRTEALPDDACDQKIGRQGRLVFGDFTHRPKPRNGDLEDVRVFESPRILRKEVIQPQVPLRLPCYDFTPVADLTVDGCLLAVSAPA